MTKELEKFTFNDLLLHFPVHMCWKDLTGRYLGCNQLQATNYGLNKPEEIIGKTDFDFKSKEEAELKRSNDLKVIETGVPLTTEEDGYLSIKSPLRDNAGNIIGIVGIAISLNDYKQQVLEKELFFEQLVSVMPGHVYWKGRDGKFLGCNDMQAVDVSFSGRYDVVGKGAYDLLYPNQPEYEKRIQAGIIEAIDRKIMAIGEGETIEEFAITPDHSRVEYLSKKIPLKNDKGEVIGLLGISFDISEFKKTERELTQAKEQARLANNMKSEFIYNMRHDLRTPFCGILGIAELMESEEDDPKKRENLSCIKQSAKILLDQLDKIFEFIHVENHSLPITEKLFNLHNVLNAFGDIMSPMAKSKGLPFTVSFAEDVPMQVMGDELRTTRILMNLVSNALKFTDRGEVKVHLEVANQQGRQIIMKFTISDTGIGFSQEQQNLLFEKIKFSHGSNSFANHGLGFRIVKTFLNDLGGDIYLNTQEGKGSVFTVLIPYKLPLLDVNAGFKKV